MNELIAFALPLAEIGDNFPQSGERLNWSDLWPYGIAAVVAAVATAIVVQVRKHNDMTRPCDDPQRLFRELCLAHRLDRGSARLLSQLAAALRLEQPAQIFLTPAAFEPARLPASLRTRAAELKQLRERLF
jgi:hypothetical protein